jgi:hypothetical protein
MLPSTSGRRFAHHAGRSSKPSNARQCRLAKLLDFIAQILDARQRTPAAARVFTPEYASLEQLRDHATTATDIYSLADAHELIAGKRLHDHGTPGDAD